VLPVLLIVALGLVQVGLILRDQLVLVEAARAGAREASVTADATEVRGAVDRAASTFNPDDVSMRISRAGSQGDPVTVALSAREAPEVPLVGWLFPTSIHLEAEATMRQEFQ
jgi:Flp pilus assembly protein TadG